MKIIKLNSLHMTVNRTVLNVALDSMQDWTCIIIVLHKFMKCFKV